MAEDDLGLDRVQSESIFDFKNKDGQHNNPNMIYDSVVHSCEYYELEDFQSTFSKRNCFSTLSLNIRSLPGKWNDFKEYVALLNKESFKFSVIALQEVWNVPPSINYSLEGYKSFNFRV